MRDHPLRFALGGLLGFVALNAVGGGIYGLGGAPAVPIELLQGSPFSSYRIPSLILLMAVGGGSLIGCIAVFRQTPRARTAAFAAGLILLGWIVVQLLMIGYTSWLQPLFFAIAVVIVLLAARFGGTGRDDGHAVSDRA